MRKVVSVLSLLFVSLLAQHIHAQVLDLYKVPKKAYIESAKEMAKGIFENLQNNEHRAIADFIVENIGYSWNEQKKITERNDYLSKLEIISMKPPIGVYGDCFGYDLIEEGFLKGSDRYFRHSYLSYHDGSILVWEFRFYVNKENKVTLHYIGWSDTNPFEYMSTPDMVLPLYQNN